jgi:tetratricopeptide (TPR) repeat protein
MQKTIIIFIVCILALLFVSRGYVEAQTNHETFNQYITDLQNNPHDHALREKIINTALKLDPPPDVPAEVERYMSRGFIAVKMSKSKDDFKNAIAEFQKALAVAPWIPDLYYNIGVVQEKAELFDDAIKSFNFYILAAPGAKDRKEVRDRIYKLEYLNENNKNRMRSWIGTWNTTGAIELWNTYSGLQYTSHYSARWFIEIVDVSENGDVKILFYKNFDERDDAEIWTGVATPARIKAKKDPIEKKWHSTIVRNGPGEIEMIQENGIITARFSYETAQYKRNTKTVDILWTYKYDGLVERTQKK